MRKLFLFIIVVITTVNSWGQISIPNTVPVTENFDGMGTTTTLPTNWRIQASTSSPTWAAGVTAVTQQASSGSPTAGGTYNWGSSISERAVGAMTSGSFASPNNLLSFYTNTHASDNITQLLVSYNAERYRRNSAAASIQFFYSLDGSAWTIVPAGDIATASFPTGTSAYFFPPDITINKTGIIISSLNIAPGSNFYLRWNINTTGSSSQGIGIDDVSVTASFSAPGTITTGAVTGAPFTVDCSTTASGTVGFTSTGTYNAGNIYTAQLSNAAGSFATPTSIGTLSSTANSGTINITIPAGTATGAGYRIRVVSSNPAVTGSDNGADLSITFNPCTISTGAVTGAPFTVDCSTTASGTVSFTSTGTYNAGNIYTAQLSNAVGSFATPTAIGTLSSTANSGTINITIPAGTATGVGYRIRVVSSNPAVTGTDNGTDLSITFNPCTISTGAVTGAPFTVDCSTTASGTVGFTSTGTYNAGNIYTAQLSNASGSFASPTAIGTLTSTANSGTINITIPAGTATGAGYRIRVVSANPAVTGSDNGSNINITLNPCSITTGAVSGGPFTVDCTLGTDDAGTVDFTSSGIFNAGNVYTVQLSNSIGSFASSTVIGTLTSTANSGTINITIPSSISNGSAYRIRVVSSDPVIIGTDNGSNITITQSSPCLPALPSAGLLINEFSNGSVNNKEYYEFVVAGRCGELVDIRGFIIDDNNGTFSVTFPSSSGIASGHLKLSNHAQWQSIPVGSLIVVYNAGDPNLSLPADDPNDSNNDSLYVIPHNNATLFAITSDLPSNTVPDSTYSPVTYSSAAWSPLGIANTGDAVQVRSPNGAYFHGVSYGGNEITGGPNNMKIQNSGMSGMCGWFSDGDIFNTANWFTGTISGNETPGLPNNAANLDWLRLMRDPNTATCPITILPSTAIELEGKYEDGKSILEWKTISEQNNSHFTISHTADGKKFTQIGTVAGAGNSSELLNYRFEHHFPHPGMNYYKLQSTDYDGTTYQKGIISVEAVFSFSFYDTQSSTIELFYESDIEIYTMDGKLIEIALEAQSIPFNKSGLFLILDKRTGITERLFIP